MILIALGSNLESRHGSPRETLERALCRLSAYGITLRRRSSWYESAPVPPSDQPWFVNGVAELEGKSGPAEILTALHHIESELGRVRSEANQARTVDLDLLDVDGTVSGPGEWPVLPHPRMHQRAFVLMPLAELAPGWRHPVSGESIDSLLANLGKGQICRRMRD